MAGNINNSYVWAINTCNAPNVGYNQNYRDQETVNGITYYDCSSFIWYALKAGGFDNIGSSAFTTDSMRPYLISTGFTQAPISGIWLPGDVCWKEGHTEMVYQGGTGEGITMGAHGRNGIALADQVSINSSPSSNWTEIYRYGNGAGGSTTYQWIYGTASQYFNQSEMENNAACLYQFFFAKGWTINAIAALCGNVEEESTFNPNCIETGGTGHGLVQWTPPEDLYEVLDYLYGGHSDWENADKQCEALYAEYQKTVGDIPAHTVPDFDKKWYPTSEYPMDWDEWAASTDDPGYLALVFQKNYERPADFHPERADMARAWYDYLLTVDPTGGGVNVRGADQKLKIWQMIRYHL